MGKLTKAKQIELRNATYRDQTPEKRCNDCEHYQPFGGTCQVVRFNNRDYQGFKPVSQNGVCDLWTEKPQ